MLRKIAVDNYIAFRTCDEIRLLSDYSLVFHKVYFYIPSMHKLLNLEE
jgi:hypothetical protein